MGGFSGSDYARFVDLSSKAFNVARKHHILLSTCCLIALSNETPHLRSSKDLYWIRDALCVEKTDAQAVEHWKSLLEKALSSTRQQLNDVAHNLVQKMKK